MNEQPSKALSVRHVYVGKPPEGEESPGQNEETDISAQQCAYLQGQFLPPETEINFKLNLYASSPWVAF